MRSLGQRWKARISTAGFACALLLSLGANEAVAQIARPSASAPIFVPRPIGVIPSPTPTPPRKSSLEEDEKPIPRGWIIGGLVAAAMLIAALFYGASRAWRSSNLFDRQYHFPVKKEAALRFGGQKSGGHMATVKFGSVRSRRDAAPPAASA